MRERDGEPSARESPTVVAATWLEAWSVRRTRAKARLVLSGIGLRDVRPEALTGPLIVCGLAGGLRGDLPTGAVIVPDRVLRPDGTWLTCDPVLVDALVTAGRRLGLSPERAAVATTPALVRGAARAKWAARGCAAVDMETGLLRAPRVAAVRVILDTPAREIAGVWQDPIRALLRPAAWRDVVWLGREAPRCARRAAAVVAEALRRLDSGSGDPAQTVPRAGAP